MVGVWIVHGAFFSNHPGRYRRENVETWMGLYRSDETAHNASDDGWIGGGDRRLQGTKRRRGPSDQSQRLLEFPQIPACNRDCLTTLQAELGGAVFEHGDFFDCG